MNFVGDSIRNIAGLSFIRRKIPRRDRGTYRLQILEKFSYIDAQIGLMSVDA